MRRAYELPWPRLLAAMAVFSTLALVPAGTGHAIPLPTREDCLTIRYNPPPCACPAFEILEGERWVRVILRDDSDSGLLTQITRRGKEAFRADRSPTWRVSARVLDDPERCTLGHLHLVVELKGWCPAPPR